MKRLRLCHWDEIPEGQSRGFQLPRTAPSPPLGVLGIKKGGQVFIYRNLCPHAFIPLEWVEHEFLTADRSLIQCANHGALFTIDSGQCIAGPCTGQALQPLAYTCDDNVIYVDTESVPPQNIP